MITSYLKEISALNKIDLKDVEGYRLYYSVYKNIISLIFNLGLIAFFVYFIIMFIHNIGFILLGFLMLFFLIIEIQKPIGRLMLKNPIFILNQSKLYYIEYNKWYDITEYQFSDEFITRWSQYYCMTGKDNYRVFGEKNWFFHDPENFKSKVNYQRLVKIREKRKTST